MPDFARYEPESKHSTTPVRAVVRHVSRDDIDALSRFRLAAVSRTRDDWAGMIEKSVAGER